MKMIVVDAVAIDVLGDTLSNAGSKPGGAGDGHVDPFGGLSGGVVNDVSHGHVDPFGGLSGGVVNDVSHGHVDPFGGLSGGVVNDVGVIAMITRSSGEEIPQ
jgi:hypothetical protein